MIPPADPDTITVPWGKFRGRTVSALPDGQLLWLAKKGDRLKPVEVREAVAEELRRRMAAAVVEVPELPGLDDLLDRLRLPPSDPLLPRGC